MRRKVVAITGLSGVGKSTLIKKLADSVLFELLQASQLINEERHSIDSTILPQDQLRFLDLDDNQLLLVRGFARRTDSSAGLIVFDSHTVIERDDGLTRIHPQVFRAIGIDSMIFLVDAPETIVQRRRYDPVRKRPALTIKQLHVIQEEARDHAGAICSALNVPLQVFHPNDEAKIAQMLQQ